MERRVLIAIVLCFLVLYLWQALFVPPLEQPSTGSVATEPPADAVGSPAVTVPAAAPARGPSGRSASALISETTEREVRIETPRVVAVFTNRGARLKEWTLKNHRERDGQLVQLVVQAPEGSQPLPFSLATDDEGITGTVNGALYAVVDLVEPTTQADSRLVAFEYSDTGGLRVRKEFTLDPSSYTIDFRLQLTQDDKPVASRIVWGPGLGDADAATGRSAVKPGGLYSAGGDVTRVAAADSATTPASPMDFDYAGIEDQYFAALALKPGAARIAYQPVSIPPAAGTDDPARDLMGYSIESPKAGEGLTFYVGPKEFETLAAIDRNLVRAINFGVFSVIVVPLLRSLNWIEAYVGNYGWAIVVLTAIINIVLFPLNHKSVVSMRKMQEIQPEAKAIQERYSKLKATDPARQKMNQELMALYRERGVNPASGCVPILLTIPVFLAFYSLLTTAIELRGAPFVGWIQDLSASDPYYVMPVLVGLSQLWQQWLTPTSGMDPTQQKMMMIMPIVLIFVFVATPVGALIYWFVGNVWRVGQQSLTNYLIGPPSIRAVRPPAERRMKRAGHGKAESGSPEG
jgi:YidC/Oxa1 family membrane protein insertase